MFTGDPDWQKVPWMTLMTVALLITYTYIIGAIIGIMTFQAINGG